MTSQPAATRPLAVTILAWIYIAVGSIGFVVHFREIHAWTAFQYDSIWIELVEILAIVSGAFMLRRHNWARWLAIAWMAFHVVLSAFGAFRELAIHALFCAVIAWLLFSSRSSAIFPRVLRLRSRTHLRRDELLTRPSKEQSKE